MSESNGNFRARVEQRTKQLQKSSGESLKRANDHFFNSPAIKVLLTMIPPTDPPELLEQLLKTAIEEGFGFGASAAAQDFATMIFEVFPNDNNGG